MIKLAGPLLKNYFQNHGPHLLHQIEELKTKLWEAFPHPRAHRLLLKVYESQFPQRLNEIQRLDTGFLKQLSQTISNHLGITHELALWAVQVWSFALGKTSFLSTDENIFGETEIKLRQLIHEAIQFGELSESLENKLRDTQKLFFFNAEEARLIFQEIKKNQTPLGPEMSDRFLLTNQWGMGFTWLEPGKFLQGSPVSEPGRQEEETLHTTSISRPFCLQITPVTQFQWKIIMGYNPSDFKGDLLPVENVSWQEITEEFLPQINSHGDGYYRLPTEAEWEFAARAGSLSAYYFGNTPEALDVHGWYQSNSDSQTHPVAEKEPNPWGLYDMYGNVLEWCQDWHDLYPESSDIDPAGPESGSGRIVRGGSWFSGPEDCRSAARSFLPTDTRLSLVGLRLVKEIEDWT